MKLAIRIWAWAISKSPKFCLETPKIIKQINLKEAGQNMIRKV
jgi:hypothetical protein